MDHRLLTVNVSDGLFPSERTVRFETSEGQTVVAFVEAVHLRGNRLRVALIDTDNTDALVHLSTHEIGGGGYVAKVKLSQLSLEESPGCHHLGQRHGVPLALVRQVLAEVERPVSEVPEVVVYESPGGSVCRAYPFVVDGRVVRIDFSTDEHED